MPAEVLYHSLSARVVGGLIDQLLFFGVFAVSLAITRRCILDSDWCQSGDFIRHLLLMFSITVFLLYIDLSYEVENFKGLQYRAAEPQINQISAQLGQLSAQGRQTAKAQLLVMLPIDLVGIALNSSLFAILTIFLLDSKNWTGRNISTV